MVGPDLTILRDVEVRLMALTEARRLRPFVVDLREQLHQAKTAAGEAEPGSAIELQFLKEAAEANERLTTFRDSLMQAERDLRRTHYLLELLSE
jgi:hypothetical protein